jgi:thiol:disulfide interchange protein DsbC
MIDILRRSRPFIFAAAVAAGTLTAALPASAGAPAAAPTTAPAATASTGAEATVRAAVDQWLQGRYKVEGVRRAPVPGILEVQIGTDVIYVDEKGQYGFVEGQLIEFKSNRNLTKERLDDLNAIVFKDLPLNLAIKQVIGKGSRVVAVFEDPNCAHCRNLRRELVNIPDLTIYTFPYPILAADSEQKSRQAWCAPDRAKAWNELVLQSKVPSNSGTCDTPIDKVLELGKKLKVTGTPTLFFQNGRRIPGSVPGARLIKLIEENSKS